VSIVNGYHVEEKVNATKAVNRPECAKMQNQTEQKTMLEVLFFFKPQLHLDSNTSNPAGSLFDNPSPAKFVPSFSTVLPPPGGAAHGAPFPTFGGGQKPVQKVKPLASLTRLLGLHGVVPPLQGNVFGITGQVGMQRFSFKGFVPEHPV
jgi:hypothetical protein